MKARPAPPIRPAPPPPAVAARSIPNTPYKHAGGAVSHKVQPEDQGEDRYIPPLPPRPPSRDTAGLSGEASGAAADDTKSRLLARRPPPRPIPPLPKRLPSIHAEIPVLSNELLPVPPPPPRLAARPPLLARKKAQDTFREHENLSPPPVPEVPSSKRRLLPPPAVNTRPILPPPVNLATKPSIELPEPSRNESCLKCHDFAYVDEHASRFPRHTISSLPNLAHDLTSPFETEPEKARSIFAWLSYNIVYNVQAFMSGNIQHATPESTLHSGLAVCDGYAGLFVHLAQLAGIWQVSKVTGHGKGYGYSAPPPGARPPPPESNHAWNRVCLDGEWRLIDPCWGAGALIGGAWDQRLNSYWFTADAGEFGARHFPMDDPTNQGLSGRPVTWEEYITESERPQTFGEFQRLGFDAFGMEPEWNGIPTGQRLSFQVMKRCIHTAGAEDNYVLLLATSDNTRTPMIPDGRGSWAATVFVPRESVVTLYYVSKVDNEDGKGMTVQEYEWLCGKKGVMTQGLAKWSPA